MPPVRVVTVVGIRYRKYTKKVADASKKNRKYCLCHPGRCHFPAVTMPADETKRALHTFSAGWMISGAAVWHLASVPGFLAMVPGFPAMVSGFLAMVPGFPAMVSGFLAMVSSFLAMVPGFLAMVPGFPAMVFTGLVTAVYRRGGLHGNHKNKCIFFCIIFHLC